MSELGLFAPVLGLTEPGRISELEFSKEEGRPQALKRLGLFLNARVTNGTIDGLNSKIKTAMKRAYGFKHVAYLRTIIYLVAGRLTFSDPQ